MTVATERWVVLAALFVARSAMGFQFQIVGSAAPQLQSEFALGYAELGFLIGSYVIPGAFLALPSGVIGRRLGDRSAVLLGLALMAAGGALFALARSHDTALAARVLAGAGAIVMNLFLGKIVADWFQGRELVLAMAIFVNSWPIGMGIGLLVLGPLAEAQGWRLAAWAGVIAALVGIVAVILVYRDPPRRTAPTSGAVPSLREGALLSIAGAVWAFYNVGYIVLLSFGPSLLTEQGHAVLGAGTLTSLFVWLSCISVPLGGVLVQRGLSPHAIMIAGCLVFAALLAVLPFLPWPAATLVLLGFVAGLPSGPGIAMPAQVVPSERRAIGMGIFYTVFYVGMALLPGLAGWARDRSGVATAPFLVAVGYEILAVLAYLVFVRLTRPPRQ
jgi:MFS family permease